MHRISVVMLLAISSLACSTTAQAEVRVARILGSHMVVQRDRPIRIWGSADVGESVTVTLAEEKRTATADANGHWLGEFAARRATSDALADPLTITVVGSAT